MVFISFTITAYFVNLLLSKPKQAFLPLGKYMRSPTDRKTKLRVITLFCLFFIYKRVMSIMWVKEHIFVEDRMGTYVNV